MARCLNALGLIMWCLRHQSRKLGLGCPLKPMAGAKKKIQHVKWESWVSAVWCIKSIELTITSFKTERQGGSAKPSDCRGRLILIFFNRHMCSLACFVRCPFFLVNRLTRRSVSRYYVLFQALIFSVYNIIAHPVNMRTDWIKNTLLSLGPGKQFCHVLSTLISALGWLWRLYSMWQRRAGDSFSWHPGTRHTDTLLWSATLILIKRCLTRAHEDQGCCGGGGQTLV